MNAHSLLAFSLICSLNTVELFTTVASSSKVLRRLTPPVVVSTWGFPEANLVAYRSIVERKTSVLDALQAGLSKCESLQCGTTVGFGGSPSETGEVTLDSMLMDGQTLNVGAVGGLRRIKNAVGVARMVLDHTNHSLLVGEMATEFAKSMGFKEESLTTNVSDAIHKEWLDNKCQPNYWTSVTPNPRKGCGPYKPIAVSADDIEASSLSQNENMQTKQADPSDNIIKNLDRGHDTLGMLALDSDGNLAAGTTTNGARYKILGRVGDSPIAGAGCYADHRVGAAAATGDGDVMMRFLLTYQAVENMRLGMPIQDAANDVIQRIIKAYKQPKYPQAAVILLSNKGDAAAACVGFKTFPWKISDKTKQDADQMVECLTESS